MLLHHMLLLAMGNGCLHNHGDDYGEIGALTTDGHITLTRADPSALGTRLASILFCGPEAVSALGLAVL